MLFVLLTVSGVSLAGVSLIVTSGTIVVVVVVVVVELSEPSDCCCCCSSLHTSLISLDDLTFMPRVVSFLLSLSRSLCYNARSQIDNDNQNLYRSLLETPL